MIRLERFTFGTAALLALLGSAGEDLGAQTPQVDPMRVTLLGTGAPPPDRDRMGPGTLVEAGPHKLLFDVGRGVTTSVREYGLVLGAVTGLFITHLHADHVIGLPDFWLAGHHRGPFGQRRSSLRVFGPEGTSRMLTGLEDAYEDVRGYWRLSDEESDFGGIDFSEEGVLFREGELTVTAFRVSHSPMSGIDAYGYRVDYRGRSVVISGDTGYSENLIEHARGTDLLVHEIFMVADDGRFDEAFLRQLEVSHTVPAAAARVFEAVRPTVAVGTHIGADNEPAATIEAAVRADYEGRFVMGEDLMTFEVGESVRLIPKR